jgi:gamma-glutamyltranspeptidase/glutathione hydrolase
MPGKRITSGISALIGKKDGKPLFALGLPGAHRIPSCVLQAVLNIVDHGMTVQEVVEAPRVFNWGLEAEVERGFSESAIIFAPDGMMTGAGCWRADGVPAGIGGGLARANTSFWPDPRRLSAR